MALSEPLSRIHLIEVLLTRVLIEGWTTNLVDTDKLYWAFFESCHNAGPSKCAMARNSDESGVDIERRFREWLISLDNHPLASIGPSGDVRVLAGNDIRAYMGTAFYAPLATFPSMASEFDNAIRGNASKLFETYFQAIAPYRRTNECLYDDGFGYTGGDAGYPVRCGDGDDVTGMDVSWWHTYAKNLVSSSSLFGAFWASKRFVCSGWKLKSNWRFTGPFTSPKFRQDSNGNPRPGYPAAPNLYLSSKIDPVTPVAAARRMQKYYPGAGLAILDAVGHTALGAGAKNKCLEKIVGQYLETGIVPKEDVLCPSDCGPWDKGCELGYVI
jgi:pimeloyl-ACP methyl ester carboxylesterase